MVLYQQAFRWERSGRGRQEAELDAFITLASRVPVLMIEHRRDFARLPEVLDAIVGALDAL
jgi:hypothetical protein